MAANLQIFYPEKELTRFEFVKRVALIGGLTIVGSFFCYYRFGHRLDSPVILVVLTLLVLVGLLVWILGQRIYTQFILDHDSQILKIEFMTLRAQVRHIQIPFNNLRVVYTKEPSRHSPQKWVLKILNKDTKIVEIETGQDGFAKSTLQNLAERITAVAGAGKNS